MSVVMRKETIFIEKTSHGGVGIGRLDSGQVVLTKGALPGEILIVTIQRQKKNYLFAEVSQILISHPGRISPACPYHKCGGCDLHHVNYQNQLVIKDAALTELLTRQSLELAVEVSSCRKTLLPSKRQFGYRQRIRLFVKEGRMGYRARNSHTLVEIKSCHLAEAPLNRVLSKLQKRNDSHELLALCDEIEFLLHPQTQGVLLLLHLRQPPRPKTRKVAEKIVAEIAELECLFFVGKNFALEGPYPNTNDGRFLHYQYEINGKPLQLRFEVGGFCQINLQQNIQLIQVVTELADVKKGERILDLYCGLGNLSLPLAMKGADVTGVEGQGSAIRSAKYNAQEANLTAHFIKAAVEPACNDLIADKKVFDTIVIDPPRSGASNLTPLFSRLTKKRLLYVSCDPATLVRDLFSLRQEGFFVTAFQTIDMFPQTHHIESVVCLEKS